LSWRGPATRCYQALLSRIVPTDNGQQRGRPTVPSVKSSGSRLSDALLRAVVWGFIGILFGILFVVTYDALAPSVPMVDPAVLAAAVAGTVGAVIYSSMRLSLLAAGAAMLVLAVLQIPAALGATSAGGVWDPRMLALLAAVVGALAGAYYGHTYRQSHIDRALPKTIAGLAAGLLVGGGWWLLTRFAGDVPLPVTIAVLCPLVGWSYVWLAGRLVRVVGDGLAPVLGAALVGAVVSGLVALGAWATAGALQPDLAGGASETIRVALDQLPGAVVAGWLGGVVAGFTRGLLGLGWYDL